MKKITAMPGYFAEFEEGSDAGGGVEESTTTPENAVLEELGIADAVADSAEPVETKGAEETQAEAEPGAEETTEAKADEVKPEEQKKLEGLTDADLAPLDSKNQSTNERFRKVTEGYKQEKQRADSAQADAQRYKDSFESLRELGYSDAAAADDLVEFSAFRKALVSGDAQTVRQSISNVVKMFEANHGKRLSVAASALDDFPDLKKQVDEFDMPEETALELVRSRKIQERAQREAGQREALSEERSITEQAIVQSVDAVKQMQAGWEKSDPDFKVLLPHLRAQMEEVARNFPAQQWPQIVEMQYKSLKKALTEQAAQRTTSTLPLRGTGHQVGKPAPATPQDAVLQELGLSD